MATKCPLCFSPDIQVLGRRSDLSNITGYGRFVSDLSRFDRLVIRCDVCGMQFIAPCYDSGDMRALYDQHGYQEFVAKNGGCIAFDSHEMREALSIWANQFVALGVLAWKEDFSRARKRKPKFLDVGCGRGRNLTVFDKLGFDVSGFDLSAENVRFVRDELGFEVRQQSWDEVGDGQTFDCILEAHIIEHVEDPRRFLKRLHSSLSDRGIVIIETPRTDDWGDARDRYRDIYHTLFFDTFTLTLLGSYCGLRIVQAHNIAFKRNHSAPNQVNIQVLLDRNDCSTSIISDESTIRAFRRCYDSIDSDFLKFARDYLENRHTLTAGRLLDHGLSHVRERGLPSAIKYTCHWAMREISQRLKTTRLLQL